MILYSWADLPKFVWLSLRAGNIFLLFFMCFAVSGLLAQDPVYKEYEYKTGLPSNMVYQIYQDSKGYLWISHEKGLSRYNGVSYRNYYSPATKGKAVTNIIEDSSGVIYCQTFTGQTMHVVGDELVIDSQMSVYNNFATLKIFKYNEFISVRNGKLVIYDKDKNKVIIKEYRGEVFNGTDFLVQKDRVILYGTISNALYEYINGKLRYKASFPESFIPQFIIGIKGEIYFFSNSTPGVIWVYNEQKGFRSYKHNIRSNLQSVMADQGKIWISTPTGVYCYDTEMTPLFGGQVFFPTANVSYTLIDKEGGLWFSTLNKGLYMIPNLKIRMAESNGMSFTTLISFKKLNIILAGTAENSVVEYYPGSGSFLPFLNFQRTMEVKSMYYDHEDEVLLIGSDQFYFVKNNEIKKKFNSAIKDIEYVSKGVYAAAVHHGIELLVFEYENPDKKLIEEITGVRYEKNRSVYKLNKSDARGRCVVYHSSTGKLFGSDADGTFLYSAGKENRILYKGQNIYASDMTVHGEDIYVATYSGRLYKIAKNEKITEVSLPEIVSKHSILKLTASSNLIWMLCDNFLLKLKISDGKSEIYTTSDGLPDLEMRDICLESGKVFIATKFGIVQFPENLESKNNYAPEIQIDRLYVNGVKLADLKTLGTFGNDENNIQIFFDILAFKGVPELKVFYSINGGDWIPTEQGSRVINLASLSPGDYRISVKAVNEDGVSSVKESLVAFRIAFPLWQRWWFVMLAVGLLVYGIVSFVKYRLEIVRKEEELKQSRIRLEKELQTSILSALRVQMNPHFIFNAMNTIQSYIFENDKEKASQYLNNFSELIRMVLDMSTRENITIDEEIRSLTLYLELEKMRFEENFTYSIQKETLSNTEFLKIPSMLIQPYVENAIKHGLFHKPGDKWLNINIVSKGNVLEVTIDDNGIGREEAFRKQASRIGGHKSFSTVANAKRLELLNATRNQEIGVEYTDKKDNFGNSLGTKVVLRVPVD